MVAYIVRRLIQAFIVTVLVTIATFLVLRLLPGDPLMLYISENQMEGLSSEDLQALRAQYGMDKPLPVQYIVWIGDTLRGHFGQSIFSNMDIATMIAQRMPVSIHLGIMAFIISTSIGIIGGIICAIKHNTWIDQTVTALAVLDLSAPGFWTSVLMIYVFALKLHLLPVQGYISPFEDFWGSARTLILPTLVLSGGAGTIRLLRSSMLEVMRQDYIRTARSKGLKENMVITRHMLKNALLPVVTMMGMRIRGIFGGTVIIETVFNIQGMGRMAVDATFSQDYQVVQAVVLIMAVIVILSNLVVDIAYGYLDPRIQYS